MKMKVFCPVKYLYRAQNVYHNGICSVLEQVPLLESVEQNEDVIGGWWKLGAVYSNMCFRVFKRSISAKI